MKRLCAAAAALIILISSLTAVSVSAADEKPSLAMTRFAYVYNLDDGFVMYEENAEKVIYPASTAKMMTAILALEYYADNYGKVITITEEVVNAAAGGTIISYKTGEQVTVEQLLYGLIVANGNDAAYALAFSIAQTEEAFVALMNEKAKQLGAENTNFVNPTGVDNSLGYTTVRDIAAIACYAARIKKYTEISSAEKYTMSPTNMVGERVMANKNYLTSRSYTTKYYLSYCIGLNAGATVRGGNCCVALASKNGITMLAVAMNVADGEGSVNYAFSDCKSMLEWAYDSFGYVKVLSSSEIVYEVPVRYCSSVDYVSLLPKDDVYVFLKKDTDIKSEIRGEYRLFADTLDAPVAEGQTVGEMVLFKGDDEVGRVDLVTKNALSRSGALYAGDKLKKLFFNVWGVICVCVLVLVAVAGVLIKAYSRSRRQSGTRT